MKTIKRLSMVLALAAVTVFTSCNSDDENGGGGSTGSGAFVKGKIEGKSFSASGQFAIAAYQSGNLGIVGTTTSGTSISLNLYAFDGSIEEGTYNVSAMAESDAYTGSAQLTMLSNMMPTVYSSLNCDNSEATITITHSDASKIEGTFTFKAKEVKEDESCGGATKNVTGGSFRALLTSN